jgi:NADPH:quinone reductase-like Zn-dependent oxidoreductase
MITTPQATASDHAPRENARIPETMRAVLFHSVGEPRDVLTVSSVATPSLQAGELLVRVDARPIQPADQMFVRGRYRITPQIPQIAGLEGTGVVVAVNTDSAIRPGTRVAFRYPGTWAEYAIVPESRSYLVPEDISIDCAAQFSLNPVTAWALLNELGVREGDWIGINAPTSAVAQLAYEFARRRNVRVLGLQRVGSTTPLDFPSLPLDVPDMLEAVRGLTGGDLLAGYLDSVGGEAVSRLTPAMKPGSTIVSYGVLEREAAKISNADLIYRNLTWKGFGIDHWLSRSRPLIQTMEAEIWDSIRVHDLKLPVREHYPLAQFQDAIAAASTSGQRGKILLTS